ncbi:CBS domain-containing protein [Erythrobacter sp. SCSIO 43205]|uniref:CBS domain-containing protein n=1 Tax=Erythrobacter sp. SCSIO 43205 TaxID=2779361 RepID=UPI001CA9D7C2|nr:CBS domain-containing protein [Erythrobacter sp. SCSIO 43205]UAB78460.1 CBS domain-containing protein [Erythrobacter sp. SCSIO 43205]
MTIAKIIESRKGSEIISCDATTPVNEVIGMLAGKRIGALPVLRGGQVAGIVSERDIIYRLASEGPSCLTGPVEAIMTAPAVTVEPSTRIDDALALMTKRRFRHFPVVENGALVAFVSIGDLVKDKIDAVEHEAAALRDYIQTA